MDDSSEIGTVGRRGFIRSSGAIAALLGAAGGAAIGAGLERLLADTVVTWTRLDGAPDAIGALLVQRPFDEGTVAAQFELLISTPQGEFRQRQADVQLNGASSLVEVALAYPFDDFVCGEYAYHGVLSVDGEQIATTAPIRYTVKPFLWFS